MEKLPPLGSLATRLAALQQAVLSHGGLVPPTLPTDAAPARLIGASKSQPGSVLEKAIGLGLADFGENRLQEAQEKWPDLLARHPRVRLHFIGHLQSGKAVEAVKLFRVIHSLDRPSLAQALADACTKHPHPPQMLIQVNTGEEAQKSGVFPQDFEAFLAQCRALNLPIVGLMCVPPVNENPAPHFALLKKMADAEGLAELSMGMSEDYSIALRLGATMIRVGTALFGPRVE